MQFDYIAHATFVLTLDNGQRLIIDPYQAHTFSGRFDYPPFETHADFALITHEHIDHNYLGDLKNIPVVVRHDWISPGLNIRSIFCWHDKFNGTKFGGGVWTKVIEADGLRVCHLGDCGEILSDAQIESFGKIDILMIPVGGFYTIDGHEAAELANRFGARTTIPCHYRTSLCSLPITGPEDFLSHFETVTQIDASHVDARNLPSGIVVMNSLFGKVLP